MRILFSGTPAFGHLLPLLPLAAARRNGHDGAILTSGSMASAVGDLPVLPAGPTLDVLLSENARRTGGANPAYVNDPVPAAEFFAGTRIDLTIDEALAAGEEFGPDLIVCEAVDFVGPMVAATSPAPSAATSSRGTTPVVERCSPSPSPRTPDPLLGVRTFRPPSGSWRSDRVAGWFRRLFPRPLAPVREKVAP